MLKNDLNLTNNTSGLGAPSSSANNYFANSDQIRVERESLERIHTFSLKEPNDELDKSEEKISNSYKYKLPVEGALGEIPTVGGEKERATRNTSGMKRNSQQNVSCESESMRSGRNRNSSINSRQSSVSSNRSCSHYVPEKVQIFNKQMKQNYTLVHELITIQSDFSRISELSFKERRDYFEDRMAEKKHLKISF